MQTNEITIQDWLLLKPYDEEVASDFYYIKLANRLRIHLSEDLYFTEDNEMNKEDINLFSCIISSFVEDSVSGALIYKTFKEQHRELYGKAIPFSNGSYDEDQYANYDDIQFLVWYYLSIKKPDSIISLSNFFITAATDSLIDILNEEVRNPEVNEDLKIYYTLPHNEDKITTIRDFIDNLLFKTYLFYPDTTRIFASIEETVLAEEYPGMNPQQVENNQKANLYENRFNFIWNYRTRLLALNGKEWAAALIGKNHPLYHDILNISQTIRGNFIYKGENETDLFIEHIASGKGFDLTKKSITPKRELIPNESILQLSINQWQDKWWCNGIIMYRDFDADLILDEKASVDNKMQVDFLDEEKQRNEKEEFRKQEKHFLSFNNNSPIAFMPSKDMSKFITDFGKYYRECENITLPRGVSGNIQIDIEPDELDEFNKRWTEVFIFMNPKQGMEISYNFVDIFPDEKNPFYKPENINDYFWGLLKSKKTSAELAHYYFDHYKDEIKKNTIGFNDIYSDNIDFLMRFWKQDRYFYQAD